MFAHDLFAQAETRLITGDRWKDSPYVFTGKCGGCMATNTLSGYLARFEKKYNLPHIHAHKFRHSMASVLYFSIPVAVLANVTVFLQHLGDAVDGMLTAPGVSDV